MGGCSPATGSASRTSPSDPGRSSPVAGVATFTEAVTGTAGFLNPLFADEDNARDIDSLVYQGLMQVGPDQQPVPLLARAVALSADHLTYSALLRTDVRWADGAPFSADDVTFTFGVLQDPAYQLAQAAVWKGVQVKKVAADRVDFTLRAPSAGFLNSLRIGIIPQHLLGGDVAAIPTSPYSGPKALGTGPFVVDSISADRSVVTLRRNPLANPAPKLDRIVFRGYADLSAAVAAVARGAADAAGGLQSPADFRALAGRPVNVLDIRTFSFTTIFLDLQPGHPYFSDPAVRRALNQAVDRRAIVRDILGGRAEVQTTPLPPSDWAYSKAAASQLAYDPEAAQQALDEAGWTVPAQGLYRTRAGVDFVVDLVAADVFPYRDVAGLVRRQLEAVGVGVTVNLVPVSRLVTDYLGGRLYRMALANLDNGPDPDQFSFWHSSQSSYPLNFSNLPRQSFIDKDLEDGRSSVDKDARIAAYSDLQSLLAEAAPALFLYEPHYEYALNRRIAGVHTNSSIDPGDRFQYVTDWYVRAPA